MKTLKRKQKKTDEENKENKEDTSVSNDDDEFNPTLAAMESEIKPKILQTVHSLTKTIIN